MTDATSNDLTYIKARLQEIKDREPHSKLLQVEALMVLELIAAQDRRFAEHLEAWRVNNRASAARIEELEKQVRELTVPF